MLSFFLLLNFAVSKTFCYIAVFNLYSEARR